jgi:hypothetical protein
VVEDVEVNAAVMAKHNTAAAGEDPRCLCHMLVVPN